MSVVWVQPTRGNDDAIKVEYKADMDFADLKKAIAEQYELPPAAVKFIYSIKSNDERLKLAVYEKVPFPDEGQIGSSYVRPYYFSIAQYPLGNINILLNW